MTVLPDFSAAPYDHEQRRSSLPTPSAEDGFVYLKAKVSAGTAALTMLGADGSSRWDREASSTGLKAKT